MPRSLRSSAVFVFVSDFFLEDYSGGGELTTDAILRGTKIPVRTIHSHKITREIVDTFKDRHWIFGNFANLSIDMLLYCCKNLDYSVIEYDYKYCKFRLPKKHEVAEGSCDCENSPNGKLVSIFYNNASTMWFMSESQKNIYCEKFAFLKRKEMMVLSSVFSGETLQEILSLDTSKKDDTWLIQKSDSWVKGTENAIKHAEENNLKYELFSGLPYKDMLAKFASSKGFIFLPNSHDTCPRTVIEAKLLGCEMILNDEVQHKDEEWFNRAPDGILDYLLSRAPLFWEKVQEAASERIPKKIDSKENTHFKIIIPAYNSESWIQNTLDSVRTQAYSNYECLLCDDMSTDNTFKFASVFESDKIKLHKNVEKKYALKNIHDGIAMLNPGENDVIVVLDGDDWFSNENVLSCLDKHYTEQKCLVTYGSFVSYPDGVIGAESSQYPQDVIENNTYRSDMWRASHLKTFKHSLWAKINIDDLKDEDGKFYEVSYDQAMMFPLLEMSGPRAKYLSDILCIYNLGNPNAVNKTRVGKQHETSLKIRSKSAYNRIET